jgi:hypothetical protein
MTSEILLLLDVLLEVLYQLKVYLFFIHFLSFIMFVSHKLYLENVPPDHYKHLIKLKFKIHNKVIHTQSQVTN